MDIIKYTWQSVHDNLYQYIALHNINSSIILALDITFFCTIIAYIFIIQSSSLFIEISILMVNILLIFLGCIIYDNLIWLMNTYFFAEKGISYLVDMMIILCIVVIFILISLAIKHTMRHYCYLYYTKHTIMSNVLLSTIAIVKAIVLYMVATHVMYYISYDYHSYFIKNSLMTSSVYYVWNYLLH